MDEATITNLDNPGQRVTAIFRPKEYTFAKQNSWEPNKAMGLTMKPPQFKGGQSMTMQFELLFDTYEQKQDVRNVTNPLWQMMKVSPKRIDPKTKKGEPPPVEFRWGTTWSFKAVITSLSQKFTLFLPNGTPVRSTVTIALMQVKEEGRFPGQNPTSGGREGYSLHLVTDGETIDEIAFDEYGDSTRWRELAAANNLDDPGRLRAGQRLLVPPLSS
jgi:nucleoid-associated protein YgaU